jgi:hypothetical protein
MKRINQNGTPDFNPLHAAACLHQLDGNHLSLSIKNDIPIFKEKNMLS